MSSVWGKVTIIDIPYIFGILCIFLSNSREKAMNQWGIEKHTWHLQTTSASIANMSTAFPLPSSPHCAPRTTVTFDMGLLIDVRCFFLGEDKTSSPFAWCGCCIACCIFVHTDICIVTAINNWVVHFNELNQRSSLKDAWYNINQFKRIELTAYCHLYFILIFLFSSFYLLFCHYLLTSIFLLAEVLISADSCLVPCSASASLRLYLSPLRLQNLT